MKYEYKSNSYICSVEEIGYNLNKNAEDGWEPFHIEKMYGKYEVIYRRPKKRLPGAPPPKFRAANTPVNEPSFKEKINPHEHKVPEQYLGKNKELYGGEYDDFDKVPKDEEVFWGSVQSKPKMIPMGEEQSLVVPKNLPNRISFNLNTMSYDYHWDFPQAWDRIKFDSNGTVGSNPYPTEKLVINPGAWSSGVNPEHRLHIKDIASSGFGITMPNVKLRGITAEEATERMKMVANAMTNEEFKNEFFNNPPIKMGVDDRFTPEANKALREMYEVKADKRFKEEFPEWDLPPCPNCNGDNMELGAESKTSNNYYCKCTYCGFETDTWTLRNNGVHIRSGKDGREDLDEWDGNVHCGDELLDDQELSEEDKEASRNVIDGLVEQTKDNKALMDPVREMIGKLSKRGMTDPNRYKDFLHEALISEHPEINWDKMREEDPDQYMGFMDKPSRDIKEPEDKECDLCGYDKSLACINKDCPNKTE